MAKNDSPEMLRAWIDWMIQCLEEDLAEKGAV